MSHPSGSSEYRNSPLPGWETLKEPDGDTESSAYDSQDEKLPTPSQPTNLSASSSSQLNSTLSHPSATGTIPHRVQAQSATTASPSSATISGGSTSTFPQNLPPSQHEQKETLNISEPSHVNSASRGSEEDSINQRRESELLAKARSRPKQICRKTTGHTFPKRRSIQYTPPSNNDRSIATAGVSLSQPVPDIRLQNSVEKNKQKRTLSNSAFSHATSTPQRSKEDAMNSIRGPAPSPKVRSPKQTCRKSAGHAFLSLSQPAPNISKASSVKGKGKATANDSSGEELIDSVVSPLQHFKDSRSVLSKKAGRSDDSQKDVKLKSSAKLQAITQKSSDDVTPRTSGTNSVKSSDLRRNVLESATKALISHSKGSQQSSRPRPKTSMPAFTQPESRSLTSRPKPRVDMPATQPTRSREPLEQSIAFIDISSDEEGRPTSKPVASSTEADFGGKDNPLIIGDSDDENTQSKSAIVRQKPDASQMHKDRRQTMPANLKPIQFTKSRESAAIRLSESSGDDCGAEFTNKGKFISSSAFRSSSTASVDGEVVSALGVDTGEAIGQPNDMPQTNDIDFSSMDVDGVYSHEPDINAVATLEAGVGDVHLDDVNFGPSREQDRQLGADSQTGSSSTHPLLGHNEPSSIADVHMEDAHEQDDAEVDGLLGRVPLSTKGDEQSPPEEPSEEAEMYLQASAIPKMLSQASISTGLGNEKEIDPLSEPSHPTKSPSPSVICRVLADDHSAETHIAEDMQDRLEDLPIVVAQDESQPELRDLEALQGSPGKPAPTKSSTPIRQSPAPPVNNMFGFFKGPTKKAKDRSISAERKPPMMTPLSAVHSRVAYPKESNRRGTSPHHDAVESSASGFSNINSPDKNGDDLSRGQPENARDILVSTKAPLSVDRQGVQTRDAPSSSPSPQTVDIPEPIPPRKLYAAENMRAALKAEQEASKFGRPVTPPIRSSSFSPECSLDSPTSAKKVESLLASPLDRLNARSKDINKARREGKILATVLGLTPRKSSLTDAPNSPSPNYSLRKTSIAVSVEQTDQIARTESVLNSLGDNAEEFSLNTDEVTEIGVPHETLGKDDAYLPLSVSSPEIDSSTGNIERGLADVRMGSASSLTTASTLDSPEIGSPVGQELLLSPADAAVGSEELRTEPQAMAEVSDSRKRERTHSILSDGNSALEISTSAQRLSKRARLDVEVTVQEIDVEMTEAPISMTEGVSSVSKAVKPIYSPSRVSSTSSADPIDLLDGQGTEGLTTVKNETHPANSSLQVPMEPEINWSHMERVYGIFYKRAADIPKELVNEINDMPTYFRDPDLLRMVFEQAIISNTLMDEPQAPSIRIKNVVDDEVTPPFEFYYSNHLWHGQGVPSPDLQNLTHCDCEGKCDPRSKTCACAVRQRTLFEQYQEGVVISGFNYDDKGRLQNSLFPIFECNAFCNCTDDCQNRVVQKGRKCYVDIVKTEKKGWGVFARKKIHNGTFVGIYSGELITEEEASERGKLYDNYGRTYLFDIDYWHINNNGRDESKYTVDAFHAGNFTRYLNHSCDPNCGIVACHINDAHLDKAILCIFAIRDIDPREELTFSYGGSDGEDDDVPGTAQVGKVTATKKIHQQCECGSRNCKGIIFKTPTPLGDDDLFLPELSPAL